MRGFGRSALHRDLRARTRRCLRRATAIEACRMVCTAVGLGEAMRDFYDILGLPRSAGPDSINDAKRRLSFMYHPDTRVKDMDARWADERIREINVAWETLSDPARRSNI